jgi:aryl-alcohol dehydrogenase-like predicted oxidoreductase
MELALGTVQFGLAYGVAGRAEPLCDSEARNVLETAARHGVRWLDTATAYGDIEQRLAALCGDLPFNIVSKLPALPAGIDGDRACGYFVDALRRSSERLGDRLRVMLFHRAEDLAGSQGDVIWGTVQEEAAAVDVELGVSCYGLDTLLELQSRWAVRAAQLPGNAFDQSLASFDPTSAPAQLQLRSAFLQGLLLMAEVDAVRRLPAAAPALRRWHTWCEEHGLERLDAALGLVKGFAAVAQCVVGVDGPEHFEQIAAAWSRCEPLHAPELACVDAAIIDPRRWSLAA